MKKNKLNDRKRTFLLITIPIVALFFCFNTLPLIKGVIYSFTNFKGYGSYDWVGLRNYKDLFTDSRVGGSYIFTFKLAIAATILTNVLSLLMALGLNSKIKLEDLPKPDEKEYLMQMDGREVFMFAVKSVPQAVKEVLEKNNVAQEEISFYILHQANKRIVEAIAKRLGEPLEKFPMNLEEYGNTSSASIPILLDELNRAGKLQKGQKIILAGFGAGLTWGASILEW